MYKRILLSVGGNCDFGLARVAEGTGRRTDTFGTVSHMPPELLADGTLTKAADVYAFGVLL